MELNKTPTPETNAAIEAGSDPWDLASSLEQKLVSATLQRDVAWATLASIKKDFVDDESLGKVVDTLFAEPLADVERKLILCRDILACVNASQVMEDAIHEKIRKILMITRP